MTRNAISHQILHRYAAGEREFVLEREDGDYDFDDVDLSEARFCGSSIFGSFRNAMLKNTDFSDCNVKTCDFTGADLQNANFRNSSIDAAIFEGARLEGTDFEGANEQGHAYKSGEMPFAHKA